MILPLARLRPGSFLTRMGEEWWFWPSAVETLLAQRSEEIEPLLARVQEHAGWAAGSIRFDAAPAFDPAFQLSATGFQPVRPPGFQPGFSGSEESSLLCEDLPLPNGSPSGTNILKGNQDISENSSPDAPLVTRNSSLVTFMLFSEEPERYRHLEPAPLNTRLPNFIAQITRDDYGTLYKTIREALAGGESYQVNGTFPLEADFPADHAAAIFSLLAGPHPPPYASFFHGPAGPVLSLSPELFFERRDNHILSRPMKGTRPNTGDHAVSLELRENPKDQAENLMIVDMIRNDLGRIAKTGSVHVPHLFDIEDHGTVWQMTSTVLAETERRLPEILKALFPCASVVGAPKVETMRLIAESESWGRGLYTGAIGITSPDFDRFNVAIRTIEVVGSRASYGVGSGVVWDSQEEEEWQECLAKSKILQPYGEELGLIETMRWEPATGFFFLERHLDRLRASAKTLGIEVPGDLEDALLKLSWPTPMRVRIVLTEGDQSTPMPWFLLEMPVLEGEPLGRGRTRPGQSRLNTTRIEANENTTRIEANEIEANEVFCDTPEAAHSINAKIVPNLVLSNDPWLRHKTTLRRTYDLAQRIAGGDEAVLVNEKGEVTETTIGNIVAEIDGEFWTPPLECGLLPGVYRAEQIERGRIQERLLTIDSIERADAVYRINSVRGFTRLRLSRQNNA